MNKYETIIIINPNTDTQGVDKITSELQNMITGEGGGGKINKLENWGKRKLAYDVKRNKEGIYILLNYDTDPKLILRLERYCTLSDLVIKYMTLRAEELPEPRTKEITKPSFDGDDEDFTQADFRDYDEDEDDRRFGYDNDDK